LGGFRRQRTIGLHLKEGAIQDLVESAQKKMKDQGVIRKIRA